MKYLLLPLLLALVFSCKKKEEVKPSYTPSYGTVRIEVTASDPSASSDFYTNVKTYVSSRGSSDYVSNIGKSTSFIKEFTNIQDNQKVSVSAAISNNSLCSIPINIKIYYNGSILLDKTFTDSCSDPDYFVGNTVLLPNYGK